MPLCLMSCSYLLILSVMVLIIYNPLLAFIDFLLSIRPALCYVLSHVPPFNLATLLLPSLLGYLPHIPQAMIQVSASFPQGNLKDIPV